MAKLIRLEFEPIFPVCKGELIFFTDATNTEETKEAIEDIREVYLKWIKSEQIVITYLGEFEPAADDQFENSVITYQSGDY